MHHYRPTVLALALAAAFSTQANSASAEELQLAPVVSTATRSDKIITDAPASVSVVTAKDIESKNFKRVDDALDAVAGVYVKGLADGMPSNFSNQIVMRGIPGYYRTAVLVDGVAINDGFSGAVNTSTVPLETIQQIEVVPGPFSALYGGNAMGGVVNIITRTPTERAFSATAGMGTHDVRRGSVYFSDKVNDVLAYSVNVARAESGGFINDYVTYTGTTTTSAANANGATATTDAKGARVYLVGDKGRKTWYQDNAGLKIFLTPSTQTRITFATSFTDIGIDYSNAYNCYLNKPCTATRIIDDQGVRKSLAIREGGFLMTPNGQDSKSYSTSFETVLNKDYKLKVDLSRKEDGYWYVQTTNTSVLNGGVGSFSDLPNFRNDLSAILSFPVGDKHFLTVGGFLGTAGLHKENYALANWREPQSRGKVFYEARGDVQTRAIAIQDEYAVRDDLSLYFGGRYDTWTSEGWVQQSVLAPYTTAAINERYDSRTSSFFSPKLSAVYKLDPRTNFRLAWGKAFHAPTMSDMYSTSGSISGAKTTTTQANPNLSPETSSSWELGGDHTFSSRTFVRATYFESDLKDLLYTVQIVNNSTQQINEWQNAGRAHVRGVEVEVRQPIGDRFSAFVNFTESSTELKEANSATVEPYVGKQLRFIPKRMAGFGGEGRLGAWFGALTGRYVGKTYGDHQNLDTVNGVSGSYDPFFIANLKLRYEFNHHLSAAVAVDNLFDRNYFQSSRMAGRTGFASLTVKF